MTPTEQNIAIAKACGWAMTEHGWWSQGPASLCHEDPPDYCNDLNAMAEARKVVSPGEDALEYVRQLTKLLNMPDVERYPLSAAYACLNATAAQHAEAFLRTKGLWREET